TLPRRTRFSRQASGQRTDEQVVAANIDTVFLVAGLDGDFNLRRLERYLAAARDGGVRPVIVLNKTDCIDDLPARQTAGGDSAGDAPLVCLSALHGDGVEALDPYLGSGQTVALLGSSGAGKSTLASRLTGQFLATQPVRDGDHRGRHTTTH